MVMKTGLRLAFFALFGLGLVTAIHLLTRERIEHEQQQLLEKTLGQLIPDDYYTEPLTDNCVLLQDTQYGKQTYKVYLAVSANKKVKALALTAIAPRGYNGDIRFLLGYDLTKDNLLGIRILEHQETPGLGDKIEEKKSNWVFQFDNIHFDVKKLSSWAVKKDGGQFDQFTGATITPRAVVETLRDALQFIQLQSSAQLLSMPSCNLLETKE